jgi:hypothetical protein
VEPRQTAAYRLEPRTLAVAKPNETRSKDPRVSPRHSLPFLVILLACVFAALGGVFVMLPVPGATFYGLSTRDPTALFYVRAIGFRDLAVAAYLLGLTLARHWRALSILSAATLVIPTGDLLLLASSQAGRPVHYVLHGASLLCFAGIALWARRYALHGLR